MKRIFGLAMLCFIGSVNDIAAQTLEGIHPEHLLSVTSESRQPVIKTIEVPAKVKLEYTEQGNPDGIPVIMLHGFTDSRHSYEMTLAHLPASMHVYALSQRGHGNSSKPKNEYDPEDFADDIASFMNQLKIREAVIIGHSMGSTIAQCFAVKYAELTRAMVLVSSFSDYRKPVLSEFKKSIDELNDLVDSLYIAEFQKSTIVRQIPSTMLEKFIRESQKVPAHVWKAVAAGWAKSEFVNALKQFNKPTLIMWGDKDVYSPRADQDVLRSAIKNSKLLVYEGTGHALHWEEPKRFANDLANFINTIK